MTAIIQLLSRLIGTEIEAGTLTTSLVFTCIGLAIALLAVATYGLESEGRRLFLKPKFSLNERLRRVLIHYACRYPPDQDRNARLWRTR